ncbi:hypothetical protein LTR87_015378 [Friedmanniomyces endolithicus]|nr:hypothetical protein LTR87_015378 [Friedmanniomyces endolithicus]
MAPLSLLTRLAGSALLFTISVRAQAVTTYQCPGLNNATVNDKYSNPFVVQCQASTAISQYDVQTAANSWNDCFTQCQASTAGGTQTCTSFTYGGAANGAGSGNCYLKNAIPNGGTDSFTTSSGNVIDFVSAIRTPYYNSAGNTYVAFNPTPYGSCPGANGTVITDGSSYQYEVGCAYDLTGGTGGASPAAANSWNDCLASCDSAGATVCTAFVYLGEANGVGAGTCYQKGGSGISFVNPTNPNPNNLVAAIRYPPAASFPAPPVVTTSTTTSAPPPAATTDVCVDQAVDTDANGVQYQLHCSSDTQGSTGVAKHTVTRTPVEPGSGHLVVAPVESATSRTASKTWLPAHLARSLV